MTVDPMLFVLCMLLGFVLGFVSGVHYHRHSGGTM